MEIEDMLDRMRELIYYALENGCDDEIAEELLSLAKKITEQTG